MTTFVVFGVGVMVGDRACTAEPIRTEKIIVQEKVVEVCREDCDQVPEPQKIPTQKVERTIRKPASRLLPEATPSLVPARRKKLLAWVKEQSRADLEECRASLSEVARVTVTVRFREHRLPLASINAADGELPSDVERCVERRVAAWEYPEDLIEGQSEILFGLRL